MFQKVAQIGTCLLRQRSLSIFAACSSRSNMLSGLTFLRSGASGLLSRRAQRHVCGVSRCRQFLHYDYIYTADSKTLELMKEDVLVIEDFVTEEEEQSLVEEVEPHLKRLQYERDHWDDAIQGYRETEKKNWKEKNKEILTRLKETALPKEEKQIGVVHVLDLAEDGFIKPHIDSVRFCGSTIAGLSLLSPSIMRFVHDKDKSSSADVLLKQRSLYIIKDRVRYDYTHEILPNAESVFKGETIHKGRRISVICRTEPSTR